MVELIVEVAKTQEKQFLLTTHSPTIIDALSMDKLLVALKRSGETSVVALKDYSKVDGLLSEAAIPKSLILLSKQARFGLIVESRDDIKVWRRFLMKQGIDPEVEKIMIISGRSAKGQGKTEAIGVGKLLSRLNIALPWKIVLDSDNQRGKVIEEVKTSDIPIENFYVLKKKELESYLIEKHAIQRVTGITESDVEAALAKVGGTGKETLEKVFLLLGFSKPDGNTKELLAAQLHTLDDEIVQLISDMKSLL